MIKKLFLISVLISQVFAVNLLSKLFMSDEEIAEAERIEAEKARRTKYFFGVNGGAGWLDLKSNLYIATVMGDYSRLPLAPTLGYSVGIYGGWQRYDYEKVGIRHTLGTEFDFGFDLGRFGGQEQEKYKNANAYSWTLFYYALEGLFDFVKIDETHRFGMSLGFSAGLNASWINSPIPSNEGGGVTFPINARLGLYTQLNNGALDLTFTVPLFGVFGFGSKFADSVSATLGYRHFF